MKKYFYRSVFLHIAVFIIFAIDLPIFFKPKVTIGQAPIIVDLKDVKLAEMTNLPPKAIFGEEEKKATLKEKTPPKYTKEVPTPKPEQKPIPKPVKKPVPAPARKPTPKPEPKKPEPKAPDKKQEIKTVTNPLKSLMDSVSALEQQLGEQNSPAVIKTGTQVANMGVEGGTGGSYFSDLTITETDAIAGKLRECWNFDPGTRNVENMIIEIRAVLNKDGTVRDVQIVDKARLASDTYFRAAAESARRAVLSCQNHNNVNIYKIFAEKYADNYKMWNTLLLRFNPMDASIQ